MTSYYAARNRANRHYLMFGGEVVLGTKKHIEAEIERLISAPNREAWEVVLWS